MEKRLASLQEEVIRLRSASIAQSALSEDLKKGLQSESRERLRLSDVLHDLLRITENLSEGVQFRRHVLLEEDMERLSAKLEDREPMTTAPPQVTVLRLAAAGDVAELEQALEDMDGASVNGSSCRGKTPLMYAASYGRSEAVASLLSRRASVGAADAFGRGAMHFAAARLGASDAEQAKMVNRLLKAGASVKQVDTSAASALTYAERWGQKMTVSLLREAGAPQAKDPEVLLLKSQRSEEAALEATPRVSRRESEVNG
ncbi:Ankef1 [Symbiodinium microadriaticum]|nr:Ankef1 [Symbiodinium microadriaticum]